VDRRLALHFLAVLRDVGILLVPRMQRRREWRTVLLRTPATRPHPIRHNSPR
jgi:hypothetical protein